MMSIFCFSKLEPLFIDTAFGLGRCSSNGAKRNTAHGRKRLRTPSIDWRVKVSSEKLVLNIFTGGGFTP